MVHWYRLFRGRRSASRGARECTEDGEKRNGIVATGPAKGAPSWEFTPKEKRRLFWLGLVEALPLIGGIVLVQFVESLLLIVVLGILAALATAVIVWLLRDKVPQLPVEAQRPT